MIHMFLYKVTLAHQGVLADCAKRKAFATWCIDSLLEDQTVLRRFVFSDEYVFHVSGMANTKTFRVWDTENPRDYSQHEMHKEKNEDFVRSAR